MFQPEKDHLVYKVYGKQSPKAATNDGDEKDIYE